MAESDVQNTVPQDIYNPRNRMFHTTTQQKILEIPIMGQHKIPNEPTSSWYNPLKIYKFWKY